MSIFHFTHSVLSTDGSEGGTLYEVLFDDDFLGGLTLRSSSNRVYRLPPSCLINLSFGMRLKGKGTLKQQTSFHQQRGYSDGGQNFEPQGGSSYSGAVMSGSGYPQLGHRGHGHAPYQHPHYPHRPYNQHQYHQQFNDSVSTCIYTPHTICIINTSGMLSIVGERESVHAKLEACTALQYEQCGIHIYIYIERERIACSHH